MARYTLSRYVVATDPVHDAHDGRMKRVVFSCRTGTASTVDEHLWQLLERETPGDLATVPEATRTALCDAKALVPADEDELAEVLRENEQSLASDDVLYLVIQPTAWCQLGCTYCGQRHSSRRLSAGDQQRLVDHARRELASGRFRALEVCWFGGEPLAGLSVMRSLSIDLKRVAEESSCSYRAKIVTNGFALTPAIATELVRTMGIYKIEVTLDGTAEHHDRRRPLKSGRGSFNRIFNHVVALARRDDLDVQLTLRCNVDGQNHTDVARLIDRIVEAGIQQRISRLYFSPVYNWGNDAGDRNVARMQYARWEVEWCVQMIQAGFRVGLLPQRGPAPCMAITADSLLTDPFGRLFTCTEVPLVPAYEQTQTPSDRLPVVQPDNRCGTEPRNRYAIGDLRRGADRSRCHFRDFSQRIRRGQYPCHACPVLPVCGGMCPKKWADGESPCPSVRYNLKERLLVAYAAGRMVQPTGG